MNRLMGRIHGMGRAQKTAAADPQNLGGNNNPPMVSGTQYANGTASPGGTPNSAGPAAGQMATGLQPVTAGTGPSAGAVTASGRGGISVASPPGPMVMPMQAVTVGPTSSQYVTLGAQDLVPLITADGAPVPATAPGRWGQVRAAGRA